VELACPPDVTSGGRLHGQEEVRSLFERDARSPWLGNRHARIEGCFLTGRKGCSNTPLLFLFIKKSNQVAKVYTIIGLSVVATTTAITAAVVGNESQAVAIALAGVCSASVAALAAIASHNGV
jgi:hypothetical protein